MSNESTTSRARSGPLDDEIDLHRLFALLIDAKWLILGTTVLALLLGGLYAKFATPIYKADALLQVEKKQGGMAGLEELSQAMGQEQSVAAEIAGTGTISVWKFSSVLLITFVCTNTRKLGTNFVMIHNKSLINI